MNKLRYVRARDMGRHDMGAHWVREGSAGYPDDSLDALMSADHVVRVLDDHTVMENVARVYAPEACIQTDADGQILDEHEKAFIKSMKSAGWNVETGWSYQNSGRYGGPIMHDSERIGGDLAEHILNTPGYWVACGVTTDDDEPDGSWVIMWRPVVHYGESRTACGETPDENAECVTDISRVNCDGCRSCIHSS